MNRKAIKSVLSKKFNSFTASISDPLVRAVVQHNSIITGGSIVSLLTNEPVNDYDIYFRNKEAALLVSKYYANLFNLAHPNKTVEVREEGGRVLLYIPSAGVAEEEQEPGVEGEAVSDVRAEEFAHVERPASPATPEQYRPVFFSANAITLSGKIQLVVRFYGAPEEIHNTFDFVHATNYWTSWDNKLELPQAALESILAKELRYIGSQYPVCSVIRTRKFIKRGWHINAGQYLKILFQVSQLDLSSVKVLEDQLIGVDSTYFNILISALKATGQEHVDESYLATIIDRIF